MADHTSRGGKKPQATGRQRKQPFPNPEAGTPDREGTPPPLYTTPLAQRDTDEERPAPAGGNKKRTRS